MKCPVCQEEIKPKLIETHIDPIEGQQYKIYLCPICEVQFSNPMENPGHEWYEKFNKLWGGGENKTNIISKYRIDLLKKIYQEKKKKILKLLELGCGCGNFLMEAKKMGYDVYGIDFDKERIGIAAKKVGQEYVKQKSFEKFFTENKNNKFDVVAFLEVLEHVENPFEFIRSVRNILEPDGYIILDVPNANRLLSTASGIIDYPPFHFTRWGVKPLFNFLQRNGFRIIAATTTIYPLKSFYENLFYFFTVNLLALIKKVLFPQKKIHDLRTMPLRTYYSSGNKKITFVKKLLLNEKFKNNIMEFVKFLYYMVVFPVSVGVVYLLVRHLRRRDKGCFILLLAQKYESSTIQCNHTHI